MRVHFLWHGSRVAAAGQGQALPYEFSTDPVEKLWRFRVAIDYITI